MGYLNRDPILKIPVGIDLDKVVAEKVMGWEETDFNNNAVLDNEKKLRMFSGLINTRVFNPSTNILSTYEVINYILSKNSDKDKYYITIHSSGDNQCIITHQHYVTFPNNSGC